MAARRSNQRLGLIAGSLLLTAAGCRGTPQPVTHAEQTPQTTPAPVATTTPSPPPPAAEPAPASPAPRDPSRDDAPVVVDPGVDDSDAPKTLAEAARAERERRALLRAPAIVITDKNLHQYAAKGQLTVADPKEKEKKKGVVASPVATATPGEATHDEQYWRSRALDIRLRWRAADDEIKKLDQRSTELRQRFYSENDSFVRDNQIKPEWDRVTDQLQKARTDAETASQELAAFLEEGRRANALPGWLREGEDQEPPPPPKKKTLPPAQSIEPPVLNDNGGYGGWR